MDAPTLLIAAISEDFRWELAQALQNTFRVLDCGNGTEALRLLRQEKPEVLVMDILLPEVDGFTLLEWAAADGICPKVLAFASMLSDYECATAHRLGIGYLMRKGCAIQAVVARVRDLNTPIHSARSIDPVQWVSQKLAQFPMPASYKGYAPLLISIVLFEKDPNQSFTKELYPAAAKHCGCKSGHVERNCRTVLDHAWVHGSRQVWEEWFPGADTRPEVSDFIRRLAEELHKAME